MASWRERCSTGIWSSMSICLAMPARARVSSPLVTAMSICSPSVSFWVLSLLRLDVARCLTASTRPNSLLTSSMAWSTSRIAWAMVASGATFSAASRRACTLPPMTRVTREAMVSDMFLLPHLAGLSDDFRNLENLWNVGVDHLGIVARGVAGHRQPQDRRQQLEAALHHDLFEFGRALGGIDREHAPRPQGRHNLRQGFRHQREHYRVHLIVVLERPNRADERRHQIPQPSQAALVIKGSLMLPTELADECANLVARTDRPLQVVADQPFQVFGRNAGRKCLHLHRRP